MLSRCESVRRGSAAVPLGAVRRDNGRNRGNKGADQKPELADGPPLDRPDRPGRPAYLEQIGITDYQGDRDDGQGTRGRRNRIDD